MSFKIENPIGHINHTDHTLTIEWIERNKQGTEIPRQDTFHWNPEKVCFRLFVGNDPMVFAKDFLKGVQFRLDCEFFGYSLRNRVVSVLSGIKSNVSALFSKAQKAIQSCFKRTPVANQEQAQRRLEIPTNNADLNHANIHVVAQEDAEIQSSVPAGDVEEEPLSSRIDRLNGQIIPVVQNICRILSRIQLTPCDEYFKQKSGHKIIFNSDNFVKLNKSFAPLQYVRSLEEIRDGLEEFMDLRPENIQGKLASKDELASFIVQLETSLEALNKLVPYLKN